MTAIPKTLLLVLLLAVTAGCPPEDIDDIPEPDICIQPGDGPIASVEIGDATLSGVFEPWRDGVDIALVYGNQGGAMVPFQVRVQGTDEPCQRMSLTMRDLAGELLLDLSYALQLYPQADGSLISDTNFAIFDGFGPPEADAVTIDLTVAGVSVTRSIGVLK